MSVLLVVVGVVQLVVLLRILAAVRDYDEGSQHAPVIEIGDIRSRTIEAMFAAEAAERRQP